MGCDVVLEGNWMRENERFARESDGGNLESEQ